MEDRIRLRDSLKEKAIRILPELIANVMDQLNRTNLMLHSSCTTYYLLLSLVPLFIMLMAIIPFTPIRSEDLVGMITVLTPDFADDLLGRFVEAAYTQSVSLLSGSIIMALWSASQGMLGLIHGLNSIAGVEEKRNFILIRIFAIFYTVVFLGLIALLLVLIVFGDQLAGLFVKIIPDSLPLLSEILKYRVLLVFIPAIVVVIWMYSFVPMKKQKIIHQIPGAVFCILGWGIFSWGFSIYVKYFGSGSIYGSLATVMFLMLWLYFCMYILFVGAIFNEIVKAMGWWKKS